MRIKIFLTVCFLLLFISVVMRYNLDQNKQIDFDKLTGYLAKYTNQKPTRHLKQIIEYHYRICDSLGIDFDLQLAVTCQESNFRKDAISTTGCFGYRQLSQILCKEYQVKFSDIKKDPFLNVLTGLRYYAYLDIRYNEVMALWAYNNGETGMYYYNANLKYHDEVYKHLPYIQKFISKSFK